MGSIKTVSDLMDQLDRNLAWRKHEIMVFDVASRKGEDASKSFVRAGVALLYAHWEGFVKAAAQLYLDFVEEQKIDLYRLQPCLVFLGAKADLARLAETRSARVGMEALGKFEERMKCRARFNVSSAINTESNLSSTVFKNICESIGVSFTEIETKAKLIDESLVNRRNKIAHGEHLDLKSKDLTELVKDVVAIMERFKTEILNNAVLHKFLRDNVAERADCGVARQLTAV